ncbi:hypothetical protein J2W91_002787 [Paenibacillus amylolyticus]|uniref:Uncharacterized protein n=1 Tax=Paenibacillus amylolyticus TaxID=1451 RepID=A0AAP5H5A2_PAEAM|nr:hypothetical protein [Paenibacillus amylolyticus]
MKNPKRDEHPTSDYMKKELLNGTVYRKRDE